MPRKDKATPNQKRASARKAERRQHKEQSLAAQAAEKGLTPTDIRLESFQKALTIKEPVLNQRALDARTYHGAHYRPPAETAGSRG